MKYFAGAMSNIEHKARDLLAAIKKPFDRLRMTVIYVRTITFEVSSRYMAVLNFQPSALNFQPALSLPNGVF
jgi:hypothetical protein